MPIMKPPSYAVTWFALGLLTTAVYLAVGALVVRPAVPGPYMDEIFHVPQVRKRCGFVGGNLWAMARAAIACDGV